MTEHDATADAAAPALRLEGIRGAILVAEDVLGGEHTAPRDGSEGSPHGHAVDLVEALRAAGVALAVVSTSARAADVAERAGIADDVDAVVDVAGSAGRIAAPPARDAFTEAATRLGEPTSRCVAFAGTPANVAAARAAGCGVVAVSLSGATWAKEAGADVVVAHLGELALLGEGPARDPTLLIDADGDDEREGVRESLLTLGNGYVATRGARAHVQDDGRHYPGTYLAGVYDRLRSDAAGHAIDEDAIVNAPNWLATTLSIARGPWTGSAHGPEFEHRGATLDLRRGLLTRRFVVVDTAGRRTRVLERRLVSMARPHLVALETTIVAENWSGRLEIRSGIDGAVRDDETVEERLLGGRHFELISARADGDGASLAVRTVQSEIVLAAAQRIRLEGAPVTVSGQHRRARAGQVLATEIARGQRVTCEKVVAMFTSRDAAISDALAAARRAAGEAAGFATLLREHEAAWARLWHRSEVAVRDETEDIQRLVNLHLFHVLQVASPNVVDRDVGLGARGLHGEGYLGHVFWDELFVLPVLARRYPSVARSLLNYRAKRLHRARAAARSAGFGGAMYPWQSASDGRDETPHVLFNPRSGRWMEDRSRFQRHVGLAVAYNFWQYFETSRDEPYLFDVGAEVILEVGRFFADLATFDDTTGRYHIRGVMGPDEFHDGYPWSEEPGIDDNAYTNVLAAWLLGHCREVVELVRRSGREELLERLGFGEDELARFDDVSRRLYVPFLGDVLLQFEGYDRLEPFDFDAYAARYGDVARLDLILEAEGDTVRRYQVGKQPDALMLFFLFSAEELRAVLGRLGYGLDAAAIRNTIEYYRARVTHGSSLSRVVHAWIDARLDRSSSWRYLCEALEADIRDTHKGTTREGIHLGAMAGAIDIFERCYPGLEFRSDTLWLNPSLPEEVRSIAFRVQYRGHLLGVEIDHGEVAVTSPENPQSPVSVLIGGEPVVVDAGTRVTRRPRPH